jgi:single-strand DNA-binding protein
MANLNKVVLIGNITQDIELRKTTKGTSVADINLAVNRIRTGDTGERIEETTFVDVTLWGRTAEVAHQYAQKGGPLMVEGRLHMDTWVDKNTGGNRSKLKVIGENIQLMGSKSGNESSTVSPPNSQTAPQNPLAQSSETSNFTDDDEEPPF